MSQIQYQIVTQVELRIYFENQFHNLTIFSFRSNKISYPKCISLFRKDCPEPGLQLCSHSRLPLSFIVCLNSYTHAFRVEETVERNRGSLKQEPHAVSDCDTGRTERLCRKAIPQAYYIPVFCLSTYLPTYPRPPITYLPTYPPTNPPILLT